MSPLTILTLFLYHK